MDSFSRLGGSDDDVTLLRVPGAFELPLAAKKLAKSGKFDAIVCLGAVIRGETPHFDYISKASIDSLMKLSLKYNKPIGNGIITCLNKKQAIKRSKIKGQEAAKAVIKVLYNFSKYS